METRPRVSTLSTACPVSTPAIVFTMTQEQEWTQIVAALAHVTTAKSAAIISGNGFQCGSYLVSRSDDSSPAVVSSGRVRSSAAASDARQLKAVAVKVAVRARCLYDSNDERVEGCRR